MVNVVLECVRNILQHNAVVMRLENHSIQLDNIPVVQLV